MEKALITDVNPVMKPPRVCSVPPSVNSGGTEVSEVKKNLLDSDSVFGKSGICGGVGVVLRVAALIGT